MVRSDMKGQERIQNFPLKYMSVGSVKITISGNFPFFEN